MPRGDIRLVQTGGRATARPPLYAHCASCNSRELVDRMVTESGPDSPNYGELVHRECFDGPGAQEPVISNLDEGPREVY